MLDIQSLREMTRDELVQKQKDLLDEQFNLRMRKSVKPLDNPLRVRHVRRELAVVITVLSEDQKGIRKLAESKTSILSESGSSKEKEGK
ncbi:MAG: 50S ribosomal protein L29 [candidate division Zixibacteria bacterium]|nr:50S ribosomal protein L29 [candidate division Zixibacteria bacterium]